MKETYKISSFREEHELPSFVFQLGVYQKTHLVPRIVLELSSILRLIKEGGLSASKRIDQIEQFAFRMRTFTDSHSCFFLVEKDQALNHQIDLLFEIQD